MKRLFLCKVAMLATAFAVLTNTDTSAQIQPRTGGGSIRSDLINARFIVNAPASISGTKKITLAPWGGQITTPYINVPVAKGLDSLGAATLTNPTAVAGKFALLFRGGGINFTDKAIRAQTAGAIGLIIVNNIPGDPVGMGGTPTSTVTIPVIMVTDVDGNAMNTQLRNSLAVNITLGLWGFGQAHDLGILNGYASMPVAKNVPVSMWSNSQGVPAYKNWVGGAICNFGTSAETNVNVVDSVVFNPTSGAASTEKTNTYSVGSIPAGDTSIKFGFGPATDAYYLTPKGTGRYDYYSRISYGNTDGVPSDNFNMFSQYVNDSIFCKGTYDYAKGQPTTSISIEVAGGTSIFEMGPMLFSTRKDYAARAVQFSLTKNASSTVVDMRGELATTVLIKWVDGSGGTAADGFMDGDELSIVGFNSKQLQAGDSLGAFIKLDMLDPGSSAPLVILDSNAWYWAASQVPANGVFLGMDRTTSYFTRSYVQSQNGVMDFPEAAFLGGDASTLVGDPNNGAVNFPFGGGVGSGVYIDSTYFDRYSETPAIALYLSKNKIDRTAVTNVKSTSIGTASIAPNPAVGGYFTVNVNLDKKADKVAYRLIDGMGKFVRDIVHNNVKEESFQVSTSGLAAGNYYLIIDDGKGSMLKKIVVQ